MEYDGTDFRGFQRQNGARTVQGELESAITRRTDQDVRVTGAGRTDSGVHALGQVISFAAKTRIPTEKMPVALNSALDGDITVRAAQEVGAEFNARFRASSRVYGYLILNRSAPSALWRRFSAFCPEPLNLDAMRMAALDLIGEQDFAAFTNDLQPGEPTYRHVVECRMSARHDMVFVRIEANAFLRGMVRNIVGTLIDIGRGAYLPERIRDIQASRDRRQAGPSAPSQGLCLLKVRYGERRVYARREITEEQ